MRKVNQEIKDPIVIEEIIKHARICRIAMTDNGQPYVLPFNFGYKDKQIFIHCAPEGKKIDILKVNPGVCFEIEEKYDIVEHNTACKWATAYRSIVGYGQVDIISDFKEKQKALEIIMAHHGAPELTYFEPKQVNAVLILKLTIEKLTGKKSGNWDKLNSIDLVKLETERLLLSEINSKDIDNIHRLHSIPEVDEFNTLGIPKTMHDTEKIVLPLIEAQRKTPRYIYTWKILLKESRQFIGLAGLTLSNDKFKLGEIYYKLDPKYWGNGYATEIAKRLVRAGFDDYNLQKVEAGVATENSKSIKVLEKIGMTREGLRRKILPIRGEWKDNYHYAIVNNDDRDY